MPLPFDSHKSSNYFFSFLYCNKITEEANINSLDEPPKLDSIARSLPRLGQCHFIIARARKGRYDRNAYVYAKRVDENMHGQGRVPTHPWAVPADSLE